MTHASVFSGIGGPEVAATMLGWDNLFHCEINPFGRKVLDYWYPNSKSYEDITTTDFREWRGRVDVLTGGFPCQPFSYAGRRRGAEDDRYLWPSMYRAIDEIQPTWVVAENVAGILTMVEQGEVSKVAGTASLFDAFDDLRGRYELRETFTLQRICSDLESHGYAVQPVLVPACAVGAPHRRDRVFIVARRIASDSDNGADRRTAREDEGKGREERIQERHEVRKPDEPNQVRPTSEGNASADSACSGEGTPRPSDGIEGSGSDTNQQPSEWGAEAEWNSRFYAILRNVADTANDRLQHGAESRGEGCETGTIQGQRNRAERNVSTSTNGNRGTSADTRGIDVERPDNHGIDCENGRPSSNEATEIHSAGDTRPREFPNRWEQFPSVSPVHRGNDGLPFDVDRLTLSFGKWRTEALKAYGNAIVPQVMYEIFRAIEIVEQREQR